MVVVNSIIAGMRWVKAFRHWCFVQIFIRNGSPKPVKFFFSLLCNFGVLNNQNIFVIVILCGGCPIHWTDNKRLTNGGGYESNQKWHAHSPYVNEQSEEKLEKYNNSLVEIRKEAAAKREVLRAEAISKEREINETALSEAHARMQKARADISAQVDVALAELKGSVPGLAKEAANKIMT